MPRMRPPRTGPNARAVCEGQARRGRDLRERKRVELRCDLALEPRLVALARMLARPTTIAAMPLGDCLGTHAIDLAAPPRVIASCGLCCEGLARRLDRAESMLAADLRHARLAVPAPALEHRLAAHRARGR